MCGILGVFLKDTRQVIQQTVIEKMRDLMEHRGPDDSGLLLTYEHRLALAHRRLSILDLSTAGHQPMKLPSGNYICFNGEIYNYKELHKEYLDSVQLNSNSDTEVLGRLLERYGQECLTMLNGMWSFIYYDAKKEELIISRDRFGVKPLYYYETDKVILWSSEIKPILNSPYYSKKLNDNAATIFLQTGLVDGIEDTFFQEIKRFPSAHVMTFSLKSNNKKIYRYYDLKSAIHEVSDSYEENVQKFRELLIDSVRLRLRSDVPVGVSLSGGMDSSSIYAIVARLSQGKGNGELHSFSSKYLEPDCDESYYYKSLVKQYPGLNHEITPAYHGYEEKIRKILYYLEEPCKAYGIYSMWHVIELASKHVKVVLDGQGGDEVLAGYDYYLYFHILDLLETNISKNRLAQELLFIAQKKGDSFIETIGPNIQEIKDNNLLKFNGSYLNKKLFDDITMYMIPAFLRYEDKIGMAFSLEARFPFLDYRLVNFLFSLSFDQKIRKGWSKAILREAMNGILPDSITWRKDKKGYPTPLNNILAVNKNMENYIPKNIPQDEWSKWRFISFNVWRSVYDI